MPDVRAIPSVAIGVHLHAEPERLRETLAAIEAHTQAEYELLLPDGPDEATATALAARPHIRRSAAETARGAPACLNRLWRETDADVVVLLESGALVGPGWLEWLTAALDADPRHGLASPSTNRAWNQLAAFPGQAGDAAAITRAASEAATRFGGSWKMLAPLWDVGDFCLTIRRQAFDAIGEADEAYDQGPCWEMDFAVRAARAGWLAVWAQSAYVWRHPFTERREREEAARFEASRRRYQDKFCGLILSGARTTYAEHCRGELCSHFAPPPASGEAPLVSCIMPTSGRPEWVAQAIRYFQRQDYPNLELVIVDASDDAALAPLSDDGRIRRERISRVASIGAMRNRACELARGEIVMHWDDDDWYAPTRVSAQVEPILEGRADITGLTDTRFFELQSWRFWRCAPQLHRRLFVQDVHGGTLAFRRSLFGMRCRYPELSLAEDAWFLHQAVSAGAPLARVPGADLFVYLRHGANAWRFPCGTYLDARGWLEESEPETLAPDRAFYAARSPAMAGAALLPAEIAEAAGAIAIGIHVHAEPERLRATLAALQAHTPPGVELLLPDGPDAETRAALARRLNIPQSATDAPAGPAACLNRLARETAAETLILLESGAIVGPGWLERFWRRSQPIRATASPPPRPTALGTSWPRSRTTAAALPTSLAQPPTPTPSAASAAPGRASPRSGMSATSAWPCAAP